LCGFRPQCAFSKDRFSADNLLGDDETPWQVTAKSLTYKDNGVVIAEGDVVITKGQQSLQAQKAVYHTKTGIAEVAKGFRLESAGDILEGEQGVFDLEKQTGKITTGRLFLSGNHFYVSGDVFEKTGEDTYLIKNCELTSCEGTTPDWSITGSEIRVTLEGYGTVKHAAFRVRQTPILYLPYMIFPAKTKRQSGLLPPRVGYSTLNGADMEVPFFWAISDQTDATFYQRYMTERGYMQGLEFRYLLDRDSEGTYFFNILSDQKEKDLSDPDDVKISPFQRKNDIRYWFLGKSDQSLPLDLALRLDADYVSDQDYLREFQEGLFGLTSRPDLVKEFGRPVEEKRSALRTSNLRLSHDRDNYSLQAGSSFSEQAADPDLQDETPQPLLGLNFMLPKRQTLDFPIFFNFDTDYDYVWREEGLKGHRASASPEINFPLWLDPYLQFEPFFRYTYNVEWFDEGKGSTDHQNKWAYETGARLLTDLERVYDIKWWGAKRLKHRMRPMLSYTYRALQDEDVESPWFDPIYAEGRKNRMAFSLENYLDARFDNKKGGVSYRQWVTLTVTQAYDIEEERRHTEPGEKRKPFEPLNVTLRVQPLNGIDFLGHLNWDHYDREITDANLSLDLFIQRSGGKKDTFMINYVFERDIQETVSASFALNLAYGFSVGASLERDLLLDKNISNDYWLGYESQCWGVELGTEIDEKDTTIMLRFKLLGLGEIKPF
jgi:LPS-assembly protein